MDTCMNNPTTRKIFYAAALALIAGWLGGCATTPAPKLYVFAPHDGWQSVAAREVESSDYTIRIAAVKLPPYVDRPQMVTRVSDNEIRVDEFNRWGISLNQAIQELLGGALARNLPEAYVDVMTATTRHPPGYLVQVEIVRLDGFLGGPVELIAQWRVERGGPEPVTIIQKLDRYEQVSAARTYESYVQSIRNLLAEMGEAIARAIADDRAKFGADGG